MAKTITQAALDMWSKTDPTAATAALSSGEVSIGAYTDFSIPGVNTASGAVEPTQAVVQNAVSGDPRYQLVKPTLPEGVDTMTGGKDFMSMQGAFGGNGYTGWVSPVLGAASTIGKTVLGYKQFEETKKMNAEKLKLMEEANFMKKLKMKNNVNQANRYQMLATGNSNNQTATMGAINKTPYTSMGL